MTEPKQRYESVDEIKAVVRGFETCRLQPAEFSHSSHMIVALWYVSSLTTTGATNRMRAGLHKFLTHHGIDRQKYHETMTIFWIRLIRKFLDGADAKRSLADIANEMIEAFDDSKIIFDYYSRELILSEEARRIWVEPDLKRMDL